MDFYSRKKKNEILLFTSKWMEVVNIILMKLSRLRRPKIACFPSHRDYRHKTIALVLMDRGHKLRREHTHRRNRGMEANLKLEYS
jgi:hypothetical protein